MSQDKKICVSLIQMACTSDPRENFENAVGKLTQATQGGAALVCLPELFCSQYFCQQQFTISTFSGSFP